ncbi:MAG TPA: RagB/SusD family nutrient uptake outer membrane protein [Gemmatimonadaceae bacterium]|nr:RagB/SusD family nutrient uptake outer membrane protein [Gemmatimonadaceae bacterium]
MTRFANLRLLGTAALGAAVLTLAGCDADEMLTENPPHVIVADNLLTDLAGFEAAINAQYAQARREKQGVDGINAPVFIAMNVGVDNAYANYAAAELRFVNQWTNFSTPQNSTFESLWLWMYQMINASNMIINRAENPDVRWSAADKARVVAEARFFRAWAYRHLTYLFGPVPLNLEESSGTTVKTDWERAPVADVRRQMEEDLLFAEANLPATSTNAGKLTKAVAQHYLAELYLAMEDAPKAETKAQAVVASGLYKLITARYGVKAAQPGVPFMDQFVDGNVNRSQGNTEVLWALQFAQDVTGGGSSVLRRYWVNRYNSIPIRVGTRNVTGAIAISHEYGGRGIGRLSPTGWAIRLYEPTDDRGSHYAIRKFYTVNNPIQGTVLGDTVRLDWTAEKWITASLASNDPLWPSTRKWDWTDPNAPERDEQFGDVPYLRYAETLLLLAEAQFRNGKLAEAAATINQLRARAKATPITAAQVTLDFILDERSRELLTEEHRRYTLLRTGSFFRRTMAYNPIAARYLAQRDTLYPIPQVVIDANLGKPMQQNPGF